MLRLFAATFLLLTIVVLHRAAAQNATTGPAREPAYGPELAARFPKRTRTHSTTHFKN
jgi:hypothetical protein